MSNGKGSSFLKGGFGCLLGFLGIGLAFVALGGNMHIDVGGAIFLFIIGGILGLVVRAIYNKGQRDAADRNQAFREQETAFQHPEHKESRQVARTEMACPHCGAKVNPATGEGLHSPVGKPWILICDSCQNQVEPTP